MRTLLPIAAAAALLLSGAGVALAHEHGDPPTGPDSGACKSATEHLDNAQDDVDAALADLAAAPGVVAADADFEAVLADLEGRDPATLTADDKVVIVELGEAIAARKVLGEKTAAKDEACAAPVDEDEPKPGDPCSTDEIPSGVIGNDGNCVGGTVEPVDLNPCEFSTDKPGLAFVAGLEKLTPGEAQAQVSQLGHTGIVVLDNDPATPTLDVHPDMEPFIVNAVDDFIREHCGTPTSDDDDNDNDGGTQVVDFPTGGVSTGGGPLR